MEQQLSGLTFQDMIKVHRVLDKTLAIVLALPTLERLYFIV